MTLGGSIKGTAEPSGVTKGQYSFAKVPSVTTPRSVFNRSCGLKTTFDSGLLIPIFADEALPGDTISLSMSTFARQATPLHPTMDNMFMDWFFFAVPIRLLWDNWEKMNGSQVDPGDSTDFLVPQMTVPVGGHLELSLSDYLGIPTKEDIDGHSSLWHRAYNLIWNEWFRSQDLQDSLVVDLGDGPDDDADYPLQSRGKRHDYFTSCLPFPQKGTAVQLPLGTSAPLVNTQVLSQGSGEPTFDVAGATNRKLFGKASDQKAYYESVLPAGGDTSAVWNDTALELDPTAFADLSTATAATINQIREAFQIQKMFERDARGGTRYTEVIRSHFGVVSPDQRLQRPEYLGGGSTRINVNPIAQTAFSVVGDLGAFVTASSDGKGFIKSFVEHSVILGMVAVRADLNYQQGLERQFSRRTRFDFYWPSLAHLGEQPVLNKEIFADGSANDELVFGYQERFAEYRYKPSKITGRFRSNASASLDTWHAALDFSVVPLLNAAFIRDVPAIGRTIAVASEPQYLFDAWFEFRHARPMPTYSVPGLVDHF